MENAAAQCVAWISERGWQQSAFKIFCGKGNNGGDGLAIARMLLQQSYRVRVYILEPGHPGSDDFQSNLQRLHELPQADIHFIQSQQHFPDISAQDIVIDALFGIGINKPLSGVAADLVAHLNASKATIVSIDLPSGMFPDKSSLGNTIVKATHTLSFEVYKTALLVAENAAWFGSRTLLPIGLHRGYIEKEYIPRQLLTAADVAQLFRPRPAFAHKGDFGHALLIAGSYGKMGAAQLAAKACLRSGVGLLTCYIPRSGYNIMQTALPEAMALTGSGDDFLQEIPDTKPYAAIGVGPGIGTAAGTADMIKILLQQFRKPIVADADALNALAQNPEWLSLLPPFSILTPHPKEFGRLFGPSANEFERLELAARKAKELQVIIVLKGHHSFIAMPGGSAWFNSTGNSGMAGGGSGDVLTGMLTALLAQGYEPVAAALMGVYLHGFAGDLAAAQLGETGMIASDIIQYLPEAFSRVAGGSA